RVDKVVPHSRLIAVKDSLQSELGEIQKIGEATIISNRVPIVVKDKAVGVVATFQEVSKIQKWEHNIRKVLYSKGMVAKYTFADIIGASRPIANAKLQALKFSSYETTVLLVGETGTGKELFAHAIHNASLRKQGPFVTVNCSALPESLLESELYGYEEGAFTGAKKGGKPGLFELAHDGSIFLDEISCISLGMQIRLLRAIQEKEVMRLGSDKLIPVNVKIIAATNEDLADMINTGRFREDLYFRLNALRVTVPPLRERKNDIYLLTKYFLEKQLPDDSDTLINENLLKKLQEYPWPGNVRELKSFIARYSILVNDMKAEEIFDEFLEETVRVKKHPPAQNGDMHKTRKEDTALPDEIINVRVSSLGEMENEVIRKMLEKYRYNRLAVAKALGISRGTLWRKMQLLDDDVPSKHDPPSICS
ncbi:sigma 54-interacting transcriptional regulator, partial [Candidatus Woesearchaeota archaeon]|nr:sigma 54-interacting transcriptional regulator [Candidatus Woesearchaeota archaeon]